MKYVKFFEELRKEDVPLVGGKNASLGELLSFNIQVPLGFAVTADAFDHVLDSNKYTIKKQEITLRNLIARDIKKISDELEDGDIKSIEELDKICANVRYVIEQAKMPEDLAEEILEAYHTLVNKIGNDSTFAIRSSATAEDLPDASFAGQQDSHLDITGENPILE